MLKFDNVRVQRVCLSVCLSVVIVSNHLCNKTRHALAVSMLYSNSETQHTMLNCQYISSVRPERSKGLGQRA